MKAGSWMLKFIGLMLKFGYITELDVAKGMVRVNFTDDGIVSNLLPVSVPASKEDKYSFPFVINEHVWCLMDDNCEFGVVGGAIYSDKETPPSGADKQTIVVNIGGSKLSLEINRQTGELTLDGKGNVTVKTIGEVDIQATKVTITATTTEVTGALAVAGALTAASFGGASAGGGPMTAPNGIESAGTISGSQIKAGAIDLALHKHTSAAPGNPTSPPIP